MKREPKFFVELLKSRWSTKVESEIVLVQTFQLKSIKFSQCKYGFEAVLQEVHILTVMLEEELRTILPSNKRQERRFRLR